MDNIIFYLLISEFIHHKNGCFIKNVPLKYHKNSIYNNLSMNIKVLSLYFYW